VNRNGRTKLSPNSLVRAALSFLLTLTLALPIAPPRSVHADEEPSFQAVQILSSDFFTVALRADGTVWAWGSNHMYQLGSAGAGTRVPVQVPIGVPVEQIAIGDHFGLALDEEQNVWVWGSFSSGSSYQYMAPQKLDLWENIVAIAAGGGAAYALTEDGRVYSWGSNAGGRLGRGSSLPVGQEMAPDFVKSDADTVLEGITRIAASGNSAFAVDVDGHVYAWGDNSSGALGNPAVPGESVYAVLIPGLSQVKTVYAGSLSSANSVFATTVTGTVYGWGENKMGQLGLGHMTDVSSPVRIELMEGLPTEVVQISTSVRHTLILLKDGEDYVVAGSGRNSGQLGRPGVTNEPYAQHFQQIPQFGGATYISAGPDRSFARIGDLVYGLGDNRFLPDLMPNALGIGHDTIGSTCRPWPVTDLGDSIHYEPKPPAQVWITKAGPNRFDVEIEPSPYSSGSYLAVDVYRMGDDPETDIPVKLFSTPISYFQTFWGAARLDLNDQAPGSYFFVIATRDYDSNTKSGGIRADNGGQGFEAEDLAVDLSLSITGANGAPADGYVAWLQSETGGVTTFTNVVNGEAGFSGMPPDIYQFTVQDPDGNRVYYRDFYYLGLFRQVHFNIRMWADPDKPEVDERYQIPSHFVTLQDYAYDPAEEAFRLSASLAWYPIAAQEDIATYHVYWFDREGNRFGTQLAVRPAVSSQYTVQFDGIIVPEEAAGFAILLYDGVKEIDTGARRTIPLTTADPAPFLADEDPRPGAAHRTVSWHGYVDETLAPHYALHILYEGFTAKIAEIETGGPGGQESDSSSEYTVRFDFPEHPYDTLGNEFILTAQYPWGEKRHEHYLMRPVDNVLGKTDWPTETASFTLQLPDYVDFLDEDPAAGQIGGRISWQKHADADPTTGYEIVFLDGSLQHLGSILEVYAGDTMLPSFHVYIPKGTEVPDGTVYLGVYAKDREHGEISVLPAFTSLADLDDEPASPMNPTPGNRIADTAIGFLLETDTLWAITHIPKGTTLYELVAGIELADPEGAEIKGVMDWENETAYSLPAIYGSLIYVSHGMLAIIEDRNGQVRHYWLMTLSAMLDAGHNGDGRVDVTDLLRFLTDPDTAQDPYRSPDLFPLLFQEIDPVAGPPSS